MFIKVLFFRSFLLSFRDAMPLGPTVYAVLAMSVAALALAALLSTSPLGVELNHAYPLSWWTS